MITGTTTGAVRDKGTFIANCTTTEKVNDSVYLVNPNEVRRTNALDPDKSDAVGLIIEKISATSCIVRRVGEYENAGLSLVSGEKVFVNITDGGITNNKPTVNSKFLGIALSTTKIFLQVEPRKIVKG